MKQILQSFKTGELWLAEVPVPLCRKNAIVMRNHVSFVSAGTERMLVDFARKSMLGKALQMPDQVRKVLRKMQTEGIFATLEKVQAKLDQPIPLGYSCAGVVMEAGPRAEGLAVGDRVACGGAGFANHAEFNHIPCNLVVKLPDNVSFEDASCATVGSIAMTGPDGKIALLNDAAFGIALPPQTLFDYARKLGFPPQEPSAGSIDLPDTGYTRLSDGPWTLICDSAPVGPDYQPGHAHADTLTFELWHRDFRLLIDSGTGEYIDTPLRREQRGTAGHNTVTVDGKNSSEVWSAHRVAKRARIVERYFDGERLAAAHDGYAPVIHRREWQFQNGKVRVTDQLSGNGRHVIDLFWHLAPECTVVRQGTEFIVTAGDRRFAIRIPEGGILTTETGCLSSEFGLSVKTPTIRWHGDMQLPFKAITEIGELG